MARTLLGLALVPVLIFLLLPTLIVIPMALTPKRLIEFPPSGFSLHSFDDLVSDQRWTDAALVSLKVAAVAVLLAVLVATTAAIGLHGRSFPGRSLLVGIILAPIVSPLIVLALADYRALAEFGLVGSWWGIALAHSVLATPYVFLTVQASLTGVDPALVRSSRSLGAGDAAVLRHVYLPAIAPGLAAGALFAAVVSFDEVVIALFLQGPDATTLPVRMFIDIQFELSPKIAAVSTLLVLLATFVLFIQTVIVLRRRALVSALPLREVVP